MIDFSVDRILAEIGSTSSSAKRLTLMHWKGRPAKLDLRLWRTDTDPQTPGRGLTLTDPEARALMEALQGYFSEAEEAPEAIIEL